MPVADQMNFEQHFLTEDFEVLNDQLNTIQQANLTVIQESLAGNMLAAEEAAQEIFKSLKLVQALNHKKVERDQNAAHEAAARKAWF
ncbi:hypothetical protein [Sediminibacillus halophilus]|uniref:Uncharacterized protein n=1 Tax=Sediminibacillus halophilus TaxID=482461 RepID=A0A1G9QX81_9BACI|nr:hypothetical protein [Sediminibacillus halophilus]SDM15563.1 hypothetical protein SAMN05216244_1711 [Sediminibacillus halophilus]